MKSLDLLVRMLLTVLMVGMSPGSSAITEERPNIVFILSDDHAIRAVSAYGDSLIETPNIDRIADAGVRFDRAYVGNAICGPSRATTLTGLHSHANGFYSNEWSPDFDGHQQTMPSLLHKAGYTTAIIGKWHLYSDPVGFDHWEVIDNMFEQGTYYNPSFRSPAGIEDATGYVADLITDKSIKWLETARRSGKPFLLMYNHKTPHRNWMPGPEELKSWDDETRIEEPESLLRDLESTTRGRREARMTIAEYMSNNDVKLSMDRNLNVEQSKLWEAAFDKGNRAYKASRLTGDDDVRWKYQRYIKTYLASVQSMDRQIGRLLDFLEEADLMENTLIVYTTDQGFFLGENGWFDKRWMDEVSSRVPLLIQWRGHIAAGTSTAGLVQNIDYAPTILDAAGVKPEAPMHGVSLLPLVGSAPSEWNRDLYYHFYENPGSHGVPRHYGVRGVRYKLAYYYENDEWELFDLVEDRADQINLYGTPGYEEITADLKQRLQAIRVQYGVPEEDPEVPWYHGPLIRLIEWLLKQL